MSHHKRGAVLKAGIDIVKQVEIPVDLIGPGAAVKMTAKKAFGYFTESSDKLLR